MPDHKAVFVHFCMAKNKRGRGYWKLNSQILVSEEYKTTIRKIITNTIQEYKDFSNTEVWELCKIRFKEYSVMFSIKKKGLDRIYYDKIEKEIECIDKSIKLDEETKRRRMFLKKELDKLALNKAQGAQLRSKALWVEDGEKNTAFFLRSEDKCQSNNTINQLTTDETVYFPIQIFLMKRHNFMRMYIILKMFHKIA